MDMSMEIFLTNLGKYVEGCLVGQWVKLPVPEDKLNSILKQIGINDEYEEFFITDYETSFCGLRDVLGEYESLDMLNELAEMLETLSNDDADKLNAILEVESCRNVTDVKELIERLDEFDLITDIDDDDDLGRYLIDDYGVLAVPEHLQNYIDYEAYGRDARLEQSITYTSYGCLFDNR